MYMASALMNNQAFECLVVSSDEEQAINQFKSNNPTAQLVLMRRISKTGNLSVLVMSQVELDELLKSLIVLDELDSRVDLNGN